MNERILTKKECIERGGHKWNYYNSMDNVNKFGAIIKDDLPGTIAFDCPNPTKYRTCRFCCYTEELVPERWVKK